MTPELEIILTWIFIFSFTSNTVLLAMIWHEIRKVGRNASSQEFIGEMRAAITRLDSARQINEAIELKGNITDE